MSKFVLLATVALATAQSTTQVFLPFLDPQSLIAVQVGSGSSGVKTLAIECAADVSDDDCGLPDPVTVTAGPSTFALADSVIGTINCKISGTTAADCTAAAPLYNTASIDSVASTATDTNFDIYTFSPTGYTTTSTMLTGTDVATGFLPVVITDSSAFAAAETGAAASSGSGAASTGATSSGASSSASRTGSSSSHSSSASATKSSSSGSATGSATGSSSAAGASATSNSAGSVLISGVAMGMLALPMLLL